MLDLVEMGESTVSPKYQIVIRSVASWLQISPGDKVKILVDKESNKVVIESVTVKKREAQK